MEKSVQFRVTLEFSSGAGRKDVMSRKAAMPLACGFFSQWPSWYNSIQLSAALAKEVDMIESKPEICASNFENALFELIRKAVRTEIQEIVKKRRTGF
jgi:hypothetical protein